MCVEGCEWQHPHSCHYHSKHPKTNPKKPSSKNNSTKVPTSVKTTQNWTNCDHNSNSVNHGNNYCYNHCKVSIHELEKLCRCRNHCSYCKKFPRYLHMNLFSCKFRGSCCRYTTHIIKNVGAPV
ncbi:unnamed protein product [Acanthoscelides obtectus]|uniref:Uncharacterized protein n=1 Tax=Acanthoscelides obtectus TaxID=200917 RepID=A0A9P0JTS8_ACAOB|nr:unnamed protein product [Acanthoscelides obtectus]CAK1667264.1 hypothetical protein AOBTE_LOCUS25746 [Acanthoscelides obtectus]